jgi:hypothetical protein
LVADRVFKVAGQEVEVFVLFIHLYLFFGGLKVVIGL